MITTRSRGERARRILGGLAGMALFVLVAGFLVVKNAGSWGVPYFSFTSENGSACTNTWTGYTCEAITPADYELYTGHPVPTGTLIVDGSYTATHDYALRVVLRTTKEHAAAAAKELTAAYGSCSDGPVPDELTNARGVCRMSTDDDAPATNKPPPPHAYTVVTGLLENGQRVTVVQVESR